MLAVSDTSFCSNNLKMFGLFLKQFFFPGIHWMLQLRYFHSFWKKKKPVYMTELLHYSRKDRHWTCALSLYSSKVLFGILAPALCSVCTSLASRTQICPGIRTWMGLHKLSFSWWCTWQPRTSQAKTCLSLNLMVFHSFGDLNPLIIDDL